ncbi:hypothetical protein HYH03_001750 [Edaphochlamys debaryana]|uniref:Glycine zipper domain-containing protein n=1 Tax=Edaphochlamys debaryana TaxID=47281 RepID=A0A835YFA9_9CHLO|nr:hypothetical protein HYH03_001750 [Edaphochlamys debaryana]|eukprot:KAG2500168.1 hypothetical protein HYH03_001750 [Edaphochlamys debaryana]
MDPQKRETVEVVEVDVIEGEDGEPGNATMGTLAGTAAGAAIAGGLAAAAAVGAPLAVAAAAVGGLLGAVAGGAVGKEVPRGVDADQAMEFDTPQVVAQGMEAERQASLDEALSGDAAASPTAAEGGREQFLGRPHLGEHEIGEVRGGGGSGGGGGGR